MSQHGLLPFHRHFKRLSRFVHRTEAGQHRNLLLLSAERSERLQEGHFRAELLDLRKPRHDLRTEDDQAPLPGAARLRHAVGGLWLFTVGHLS